MVVAAEKGEVVQVGGTAVDPGGDVVLVAPFGWVVAAGKGASAVAGDESDALGAASESSGSSEVQGDPGGGHDGGVDLGFAGEAEELFGGDEVSEAGLALTGAVEKVVDVNRDDDCRGCSWRSGPEQRRRRV